MHMLMILVMLMTLPPHPASPRGQIACAMLCHDFYIGGMSCHITSYHTIAYHTIICHGMSCHAMLCCVISYHAMSNHITTSYNMLWVVML